MHILYNYVNNNLYGNEICYVKIIRITIIVGILVKPIIARVFVYNCVSVATHPNITIVQCAKYM